MGGGGSGVKTGRHRRRYLEELEALDVRDLAPRALKRRADLRWEVEPLYKWVACRSIGGEGLTVIFRGRHEVRFAKDGQARFLCQCGRLLLVRYLNIGISWCCRKCLGLSYSAQRGHGFDHWDTLCRAAHMRWCSFRKKHAAPLTGQPPPHLSEAAAMAIRESWEKAFAERRREWAKKVQKLAGNCAGFRANLV